MRDPLKRASLNTLCCIVQCGGRVLTPSGGMVLVRRLQDHGKPNVWFSAHQAEAEIERRFKRLKKRIKELI
jgi:hypothetical protein